LLRSFTEAGVDTHSVSVVQGERSATCFIPIDGQGNRMIFALGGASLIEDVQGLNPAFIANARTLYIGDAFISVACAAARAARTAHATVFFSPGGILSSLGLKALSAIFALTDVLLVSRTDAAALVGDLPPEQAVDLISRNGPGIVIETLGEEGAALLSGGVFTCIPACRPPALIDTTGAGDAFAAGVVAGFLEGHCWEEAVRWGCAAASLKIAHLGAQNGLPSQVEVMQCMEAR
jgi:sugar/nucleoside kinase (ribokinase family)